MREKIENFPYTDPAFNSQLIKLKNVYNTLTE